jgi:D-lactate dehydrogenase (cytochrome)
LKGAKRGTRSWIEALGASLGDAVSTDREALREHGRDEGNRIEEHPPECVVYARNKDDVRETARVARRFGVPVTVRGAGSSLEGSVLPISGGISLNVSRMDEVLSVDATSMTFTAEAGVRREQLNRTLQKHGLFFPINPGANATLGGMAATNASGSNALKYGSFREQVLGLEVVLADGRTLRLGSEARKSSSGYALSQLFVGSEGTLGIVTELNLLARPIPAITASARALFSGVQSAVKAAVGLTRAGLNLSRLEMVDAECIRAVNRYKSASFPERTTLWIEFHGSSETAVATEIEVAERVCRRAGTVGEVPVAWTREEHERLWKARHHAWYAVADRYRGQQLISTDTCVPVARLPEAIDHTRKLMLQYSMVAPIVGHVGDGNYHVVFHAAPEDEEGRQRLQVVIDGMVRKALELGGTCTGEHGVGIRKRAYQRLEHGDSLVLRQR